MSPNAVAVGIDRMAAMQIVPKINWQVRLELLR
jgi:hypothetical protein